MKRSVKKKITAVILTLLIVTLLSACVRTETVMKVKRNGNATITVDFVMDAQSIKEIYGMPTNFYDAVETDQRFPDIQDWDSEYIDVEIDGVNYLGIRRSKSVSKKEIEDALKQIYGKVATVSYEDRNFFGTRKIMLSISSFNSGFPLKDDAEKASMMKGEIIPRLVIESPAAVKNVLPSNTTIENGNTVVIDMTDIAKGTTQKLDVQFDFFDFTFFIPVIAIAAVVIAAGIVALTKFRREKKQNAGLSSIKLDKKPAKADGFAGFGSGKASGEPKAKAKGGMSFAKKPPKYTSKPEPEPEPAEEVNEEPAAAPAPAPAPAAAPAPAKPAPFTPSRPAPAPAPAPAPQANTMFHTAETVGAAPAAPAGESYSPEAPASARMTTQSEESASRPAYGSAKMSFKSGNTGVSGSSTTASAKMNSKNSNSGDASEGHKSLFTPRSTAPNMSYGHEEDFPDDSEKDLPAMARSHKPEHPDPALAEMFTPRSTAPNLEYGFSNHMGLEDDAPKKAPEQPKTSASSLFTPRSTAPNVGYGFSENIALEEDEKEVKDPFLEKHEKTSVSDMFTPRSTVPNYNYGIHDDLGLGEEDKKPKDPFMEEHEQTAASSLFTPRSTAPNLYYGHEEDLNYNYDKKMPSGLHFKKAEEPAAPESTYSEPAYTDQAYEQSGYDQSAYDQSAYDQSGYDQSGYDQSGYDQSGYGYSDSYGDSAYSSYDESSYTEPSYNAPESAVSSIEYGSSSGNIYQTAGFDSTPYQSANVGASEKSEAVSKAYGGSKLGSGAYLGGATTGAKIGRSVGNIGGYVDETTVNTSSYGSDPYGGSPLPKLGESGADGGGIFAIDSSGSFGGGGQIGGGTFGSGSVGGSYSSMSYGGTQFEQHTEVSSSYGKRFNTGGSGKFDFGMASGNSGRKCPFCKEPIRDDDIMCIACGAELSRPYGSY